LIFNYLTFKIYLLITFKNKKHKDNIFF